MNNHNNCLLLADCISVSAAQYPKMRPALWPMVINAKRKKEKRRTTNNKQTNPATVTTITTTTSLASIITTANQT